MVDHRIIKTLYALLDRMPIYIGDLSNNFIKSHGRKILFLKVAI